MSYSVPDICDEFYDEIRVLDPVFNDYGARRRFSGPVVTVKCFEDNSLVRDLVRSEGRGRVLVVDTQDAKESLWACEQALRSGRGGAVLAWPGRIDFARLRRLQLAAERGDCLGVLFRPLRDAAASSPAALRLKVSPSPLGLDVEVLKRRAGWGGQGCSVRLA